MGNSYGLLFKLTTFGESHKAIIIICCPAGFTLNFEDIQMDLDLESQDKIVLHHLEKKVMLLSFYQVYLKEKLLERQ